jgi:SH3 domain protein
MVLGLALLTSFSSSAQEAAFKEGFVSGLSITVRRGPGIDFKIIDFLSPGTEVELLEAGSGWAKVSYGEERTGWVLERYLTEEAPPASKAEALRDEQVRLKKAIEHLKTLNASLKPGRAVTRAPTTGSEPAPLAPPHEITKALELARRLIDRERENLKSLRSEIRANEQLEQWFLIGAGVAGMGMILGSLTPRFRRPVKTEET